MVKVEARSVEYMVWDHQKKTMSPVAVISFGDDGSALTVLVEPAPKGPYHYSLVHGESCTLLQYTNAKDKNGKKIFEGNLIRQNMQNAFGSFSVGVGCVCYCSGCDQWEVRPKGWAEEPCESNTLSKRCEVIGTVQENPELLQ